MRVLVAIVTHNSGDVISECIDGLAWLAHAEGIEGEIVVVDNASRDNTLKVLDEKQVTAPPVPLRVVPSLSNAGWGEGNNIAIRARQWDPDLVLLCNPDASIDESAFRLLASALQAGAPEVAIAVPFLETEKGRILGANPEWGFLKYLLGDYTSGRWRYERFQRAYSRRQGRFEIRNAYASGALMLLTFEALQAAGLFDSRIFMFNDDIDVTRRILQRDHTMVGVAGAVGRHAGGRGSRLSLDATSIGGLARMGYESELVFVEKWYGKKKATLLALYRWHIFFRLNNVVRRLAGRRPIDYSQLRAPSGLYLNRGQGLR